MPRKKAAKKIKLDDLDKPLTEKEMKESTGGTTFIAQYVPPPPALSAALPQGAPQVKSPSPEAPPALAPGLHLQVTDGAIVTTNNGGSLGFQAGQFGYVPGVNQPPVIVPSNPGGIQFTPPPTLDAGTIRPKP